MAESASPRPATLKRLILCLDGTWNRDDGAEITNIVRIRDLIDPLYRSDNGKEMWAQRVFYHTGVGTGFTKRDKLIGGGTGAGLDINIRHAYRFLSQHYRPGVEIFIFGFSRGAFTARSLAGYIGASGLLRPENCTRDNEDTAWEFYRTLPGERFPNEQARLASLSYPDVRVKLLGVFDTVGALGVPIGFFSNRNRQKYSFHDVALGSNIDHALHALAIDEKRGPFAPSVWQYPNHKSFQSAEQVWFPGVHANVGGGYPKTGLSDLALEWMLSRIEAKGIGLKLVDNWRLSLSKSAFDELHESRSAAYVYSKLSPMLRVINQCRLPAGRWMRSYSLSRHAKPLGEMLHISALQRWKNRTKGPDGMPYRPVNIETALKAMFDLDRPRMIPIVGEDGRPLDWFRKIEDREALLAHLPDEFQKPFENALARLESSGADMDVARSYQQPVAFSKGSDPAS